MTPLEMKLTRVAHGLSQTEWSDLLGVSRQTVSSWERGQFNIPEGIEDVIALATRKKESAE